jgi:hypothetical protein
MTMQTNIAAAFVRVVNATNAVNAKIGNLTTLNTTEKASVVGALNELKTALNNAAIINDAASSGTSTWSSNKIQTQINAAISALINGADGASDTLKELADKITALVQADNGLVSFAAAQTLTAPQQLQAGNNLDIGDPNWDYVPAITAALASGL